MEECKVTDGDTVLLVKKMNTQAAPSSPATTNQQETASTTTGRRITISDDLMRNVVNEFSEYTEQDLY